MDISDEQHYEVFALIDLDLGITYGFKFILKNKDDLASDTFFIPEKLLQES